MNNKKPVSIKTIIIPFSPNMNYSMFVNLYKSIEDDYKKHISFYGLKTNNNINNNTGIHQKYLCELIRDILLLRTGYFKNDNLFKITKENCKNDINFGITGIIFIEMGFDEKLFREYVLNIINKIEEKIGYTDIYTAVYSAYSEDEDENIENCISKNIVFNKLFYR